MSALPKHDNPAFWMETRVVELPIPESADFGGAGMPRATGGAAAEEVVRAPSLPRIKVSSILRFERTICFAIIVFALLTLSSVSHQVLMKNVQASDTRASIRRVEQEIGRLREQLQEARAGLETSDAPEGAYTMPIEPGDVAIVTLPPP